jgi:putative addiction module component (TIGR02574 family)
MKMKMKMKKQDVFEAALALSEKDRALLADKLLQSLPAGQSELSDEELAAELDRRFAEFKKDPSTAVLWSQFKPQD